MNNVQKFLLFFVFTITANAYAWPDVNVAIAKETQDFLAKFVATLTANVPKELPNIPITIKLDVPADVQKMVHALPAAVGNETAKNIQTFNHAVHTTLDHAHANMQKTLEASCQKLNMLPQTITHNFKSIPIMGLGFVSALYALQLLKNNLQELSCALEAEDEKKQRAACIWSATNLACLLASVLVIIKSDALVTAFI